MTRDIGNMPTPPTGVPLHPREEDTRVRDRAGHLHRRAEDASGQRAAQDTHAFHDLYVLGRWFAKPRGMAYALLAKFFHPESFKYAAVKGGIDLHNRFLVPFRSVAGAGACLHEFHSVAGHLGTSFEFPDNAPHLTKSFGIWHDLILKSFFLEMLSSSYPTAGETLARLWMYNMNYFGKADSQLRALSAYPQTNNHSRAAALRVYGYTTPFFARCHPLITSNTMKYIASFQTHQSPLVATAAMLSLRTLSGIVR